MLDRCSSNIDYKMHSRCVHYEQILVNGELKHNDSLFEVKGDSADEFASAVEDDNVRVIRLRQLYLFCIVFLIEEGNRATVVGSSAIKVG